jgi:transcriptional enhancer factor
MWSLCPQDQVSKDKALQSMASMSSAQIVSASVLQNKFSPPSPLPQAVFSTSSRVGLGRVLAWGMDQGFLDTETPPFAVLEWPPSPGTAAWTLSGVSIPSSLVPFPSILCVSPLQPR